MSEPDEVWHELLSLPPVATEGDTPVTARTLEPTNADRAVITLPSPETDG